jgi:hypothetical protein
VSLTKRHIETIASGIERTNPGLFMDAVDWLEDIGDEADIDGFMDYTENTTEEWQGVAALMAAGDRIASAV